MRLRNPRFLLPAVLVCALPTIPDEGQWLPQQIRAMNWTALEARGMQLTKDEFWHPTKGGVLSAAVQINGCSASFCSPNGLVVTNHHCGFGAVNALSTPEANYLRDGFVANDLEAELPAPNMEVYVVRRIENVTDRVLEAQAEASNDLERYQRTQQIIAELVQEGEQEPNTACSVESFFEGREYHRYFRTRIRDVRLSYAPPQAIGEYGGEVDNWEWPRHTGDFTFFRAYVAPDGTPREYDEANVPFEPEHFLKVSRDGVQEDDLVLIMGYPGQTERYLTSVAVQDREGIFYPLRLELFASIIDVLESHAQKGDQERLDYASLIKSLANVKKNAEGMIWGLDRNAVVARKTREEEQFRAWVAESPDREKQFGSILDDLIGLDLEQQQTTQKDLVLGLLLSSRINPWFRQLVDVVDLTLEDDSERGLRIAQRETEDFDSVQVGVLTLLLDQVRMLEGTDAFEGRNILEPDAQRTTESMVQEMLENSSLTTAEGRAALVRSGRQGVLDSEDPLVGLAVTMLRERAIYLRRNATFDGKRIALGKAWISAQQEWRGATFYPDANSTMRVSIASVKGYEPYDGAYFTPHTTVQGLVQKHTGQEPFDAPDALLAAAGEGAEDRRDSEYFDERIGDVPVCFLSDGDTTGGNSGSPVVNGKGELVGLNFDRVFQNVSGDYGWNAERSRNVSVDIRYVLWCLESVMPAHHLLKEMGVRD
ncbi:MAG: S46 family peptidase [Planctomycetota bacterium]